jgi:hypothetical protein
MIAFDNYRQEARIGLTLLFLFVAGAGLYIGFPAGLPMTAVGLIVALVAWGWESSVSFDPEARQVFIRNWFNFRHRPRPPASFEVISHFLVDCEDYSSRTGSGTNYKVKMVLEGYAKTTITLATGDLELIEKKLAQLSRLGIPILESPQFAKRRGGFVEISKHIGS